MWIDVLIVLGMVMWAYIAVRYLKRPRRRGCNRDCTKCGACRTGRYGFKTGGQGEE